MHTSSAAVRSSPTHWNVNGSIANTSRLVVSIATYSPGRSATSDPRSSLGALCALRRLFAGRRNSPVGASTSSTIRLNVCREHGSSSGSPLSRASRLATLARNCILRTSERVRQPLRLGEDRRPQPLVNRRPDRRPGGATVDQRGDTVALKRPAPLAQPFGRAAELRRLRLEPLSERRAGRIKLRPRLSRRRPPGSPER